MRRPLVLGIETSCDETAAAVVAADRTVLAEAVFGQTDLHARYGGVVPEIAARAHAERLDRLVEKVLADAGLELADLDAIAVTAGPGLVGGLLVGIVTAQALGAVAGLPVIAVNHLEAHALTARLTHGLDFPFLVLLVSGGHSQFVAVEGVGRYRRLGTTVDDAVGEAFDKVAKMLGLGYPGGPAVESAAEGGDPGAFDLPRPLLGRPGCDLSFSGLKTAVRRHILALGERARDHRVQADLCASFQRAVCEVLTDRTRRALAHFREGRDVRPVLVVAGGVAANRALRAALADLAREEGAEIALPPLRWCGDNAVMVAWAGIERLRAGRGDEHALLARPRWPLDGAAEPPAADGAPAPTAAAGRPHPHGASGPAGSSARNAP